MSEEKTLGPEARVHTPWVRVPIIAVALSIVVGVILLAFAWPAVTADPKDIPVGIVGTDTQVDQVTDAVDEKADGAVKLDRYDDRDAAVTAIKERKIYGAIVLGATQTDAPEVLTATAANAQVAQILNGIATQLQTEIDAQLRTAIETQLNATQASMAEKVKAAIQAAVKAALAGQQPQLPDFGSSTPITLPSVTVKVTDVVPFTDDDPRGAGLTAAMFPLVMGGMIGGIGLTLLVKGGGGRRVVGLLVYASAAGLVLTGVLQGMFGALQGDYWLNAAAIALSIAAISGTITGLAGLIGPAGVGVGAAFTMLIANPLSAATIPVEFIRTPWGAIGQHLPPGAAATLIRDLSYFPDADVAWAWWLLAIWAAAGIALTLVDIPGRRLRAGVSHIEHPYTV